ncbi:hypothetical protein F442_22718 [Phytophthora nicotianae P10297]|uniref:Uncharacterized protein n=1 Tax=Phytophthora nicotianae P10297 TaxID=1317064 RepID=W2Y1C7_PHYNI|nr:hypothetical protein F442_22718 [Phytophthora nicotianae P10297]
MFVDRYRGLRETDAFGWKLTTYWVTKKFLKFRSHLVARDTNAAAAVRFEFSRTDEELMEVKDIRSQHLHNEAAASRTRQGADTIKQADRPRRISSIPTPVLEALPVKDGKKKLYMKAISKEGCTGNGNGGCFDPKRSHFKPDQLPEIVKAYIDDNYKSLAPTDQDS